jgi:hypothetical protein
VDFPEVLEKLLGAASVFQGSVGEETALSPMALDFVPGGREREIERKTESFLSGLGAWGKGERNREENRQSLSV